MGCAFGFVVSDAGHQLCFVVLGSLA